MYKDNSQLRIEDYVFPYGKLDGENDWVRLAALVPWEVAEGQAKKQEYQDNCDRNAVEGIFGTGKTAYGLARITTRLKETAFCVIGVARLLLNPSKSLRSALALFCLLSVIAIWPGLRSRSYLKYV